MNTKNNKVIYIAPGLNFFNEGYRGRVMHALGVCEGLAENGFQVTLVGGDSLGQFAGDIPDGIEIVELSEPKGILKHPIWYRKLITTILNRIKKDGHTILIARYAVLANPFLNLLSRKLPVNVTTILEINSFMYHMVGKSSSIASKLISKIESITVNRFDFLYLVSEAMMKDSRSRSFSSEKFAIPNGATSKKLVFSKANPNTKERRLIYFGTLMHYWDFEHLAESINKLHEKKEVPVVFFGDGPKKEYLTTAIYRKDLVAFHGRFSRNELGDLIYGSDILLMPPKTKKDMILTGGLSTKLFDYLALKLPIIAPAEGEITTVLKSNHNSQLYDRSNPDSFVNTVLSLMANDEKCKLLAENAHSDFLKFYSWKARMNQLISNVHRNSR